MYTKKEKKKKKRLGINMETEKYAVNYLFQTALLKEACCKKKGAH